MDRGYVKLWRKSLDSRVFKNEGLWKLWSWCLMKASHKKRWTSIKIGKGEIEVEILPGQFVFGRNIAAKELNSNPSTIWKRMKKLKNIKNLTIQSNNQYSLISIINWECYHKEENKSDNQSNNQVTTKEQLSDTDKNVKNVNNKSIYTYNFLKFWEAYPNKKGKGAALKAYKNIKEPKPMLKEILIALQNSNNSESWQDKKYIPHPSTWLNQRRWEDEEYREQSKPKIPVFKVAASDF